MELVLLPLQVLKKSADSLEIAVALHQPAALVGGELVIRNVEGNSLRARGAAHFILRHAVARLGPGFHRAFGQSLVLVGNHQVEIEINGISESLAPRAGPVGIVERKQTRLGILINDFAGLALKALIEDPSFRGRGGVRRNEFQDRFAGLAVAKFHRIDDPLANVRGHRQAVHQNVNRLREIHVEQGLRRGEFKYAALLV